MAKLAPKLGGLAKKALPMLGKAAKKALPYVAEVAVPMIGEKVLGDGQDDE